MTSWPSSAAAGSRQELIEVQRVPPSASGRAIMIAQAPHSPSAQPSLAAVRPWPRRKSRAFMYVGPSNSRVSPLTETSAIERSVVVADRSEERRVGKEYRVLRWVDSKKEK